METIIGEIAHLKKSFGNNRVLDDISFKIGKGENLVVLGKSGSGKSVLIKCLVGLLDPDQGDVTLFGKNIAGLSEKELNLLRKKIGFLFQSAALYDSMSVKENLEFPLRDLKSKSKEEIDALVIEALENVGLESAINKMPSELSGGMRKRVGLARTLILKPDIILYDEPTTGLDPITSEEISQLILNIQKKYNTASIIITHDIECARVTANRMLIIKDGLVLEEGTFDEISELKDPWIRTFLTNAKTKTMEKKTGNKIKLGVFVTFCVVIFIAGIYFIGQRQQMFSTTFHISGVFKDISGLQVGNNVRYSGINVGIVEDIQQITDSTVRVDMEIDEHTRKFMKKNVKAIIGSDGLMGNKIISIIPGSPGEPEISNNDIIGTVKPVNIDDIMVKIKVTGDNMADITGYLSTVMKSISQGKGTIGKLLMDSTMAQNVGQAMVNIKQGAGGFKKNMDAAGHSFLLRGYLKKKDKETEKKKEKK